MVFFSMSVFVTPGVESGVTNEGFDTLPAQIMSNTDSTNFYGASSWTFFQGTAAEIACAGINDGGNYTNGLSNDYPGDQVLFLNYNGLTSNNTIFIIEPTDRSNFKLVSFQLGNNLAGYSLSVKIYIYLKTTLVGSASFDLNTSSTLNGITYTYLGDSGGGSARPYGTFTFDSTYQDVDDIRLFYTGPATPIIDNITVRTPTGSANIGSTVPKAFKLYQNYPNPFNPTTNIKFSLPEATNVKLVVYNALGQEVRVLVDQKFGAGSHNVPFNAANLTSGIYLYKIETKKFVDYKKMILMK